MAWHWHGWLTADKPVGRAVGEDEVIRAAGCLFRHAEEGSLESRIEGRVCSSVYVGRLGSKNKGCMIAVQHIDRGVMVVGGGFVGGCT